MKWFDILEEIGNASGKAKLAILQENKNDELLADVLHFLFNPRIVTGISKKKMAKEVMTYETFFNNEIERVIAVMNYLAENNTGTIENLSTVKSIIESTEDMKERQFLESLVVKDMPIGISGSTINKAFKDLIPVFKLQKGKLYEGEEILDPQVVSLKLDGNSATVFNNTTETFILSRSGAIMEGLDHIIAFYREHMPFGYVYQGELIAKNYDGLAHGELFRFSNGITNSKKNDEKQLLQHVVFDVVPTDDFEKGKCEMAYLDRLTIAQSCVEEYEPYASEFQDVEVVPVYAFTSDIVKIMNIAKEKMLEGFEGLMICTGDSIYKKGKQKWLQKIKEFNTMDLEVVALKEHIRGGKVGALVVKYKGEEVAVGGIKDADRIFWWNNQNAIIGQIIEVKYFRETTDKNGKVSLRFPTFVRVRTDKIEESYD